MQIKIEGIPVEAGCGESLLSLIEKAGLNCADVASRPLAARIGGEVYNLHYDPIRPVDGAPEPRSAILASKGEIALLRYGDTLGRRVYERTLLFVLLAAIRNIFPDARVLVQYALGPGLYLRMDKSPSLSTNDIELLERESKRIVSEDLPFIRERWTVEEAAAHFTETEQIDKVRLLKWRRFPYFDVYRMAGYTDYFYGEMAPSTGYVSVFELHYLYPGMVLLLPNHNNPEIPAAYRHSPKLANVFDQSESWGRLLHCSNVADLNEMTQSGRIRELMRVNEALHEKSYSNMADQIVQRNVRAVMMAGPSSSGKTSSANRLYTQLRVMGKQPVLLSLDDYYIDRDAIPLDEFGEQDLEHVETLDIERFRNDLELLVAGERVEVPEFDFKTGKRKPHGRYLQTGADEPLIIEGIHGLNPVLLSPAIPKDSIFRVYVSALTTLNIDDHNRIRTTDIRLLRRMVRDYEMRNSSPERTLSMWASVQRGENRWIFPFQEQADLLFNTALVYEIAVLKKHIYPLLLEVREESRYYAVVHDMIKFLNYFEDAHIEDEVPPTSILREFIGGSAFFRG